MGDVILERSVSVMKLDDDEQALMDEIEIAPVVRRRPKPIPKKVQFKAPQPEIEPDLSAFMNPNKQTASQRPPPEEEMFDHGDEYDEQDGGEYEDQGQQQQSQPDDGPSAGYTSIDDEKADLLNKLSRLGKKGFAVNKRLNAYSSVQELRTEYKRIMYSIEVEQSVKFSRRMLIACVSGLEFLNKRYDPFDVQLNGWSEAVMENLDDYDTTFEELYAKYKTKMNMAPEVKLIMMLGGSAMMFHLTNSMFKTATPETKPDIMKNMMETMQQQQQQKPGPKVDDQGRHIMQGPGFDISSLMGGIMMPPPPPMNSTATLTPVHEVDSDGDTISDIVSVSGESTGGNVKDVRIRPSISKKASKKPKNAVSM